MSWEPGEPDVNGYTIYYRKLNGDNTGSITAEGNDTSATISELDFGVTYTINISANSSTLPSTVITKPNITLGTRCAENKDKVLR